MNPTEASTGPVNPNEPVVVQGMDTSTHKIFGVPRRVIGFGFALFLLLVVLAFVYSQFASKNGSSMMESAKKMTQQTAPSVTSQASTKSMPSITGSVTPDTVVDDILKEATADQDSANAATQEEVSDVQDGSNN